MENKGTYYLCTAIAYTSGKPHIGNMYEIVLGDAIARWHRQAGYDVRFMTGTDEHGQKVEERARQAGKTPQQFVDEISDIIKEQDRVLNISYDKFVRTTDDYHVKAVQHIFRYYYDHGDVYKGHYKGMYCQECESFYTKSELTPDGKCPVCGGEVHEMEEEAYFFRMSKYQDQLMKYIEDNPKFIEPESRKNEMINNFLKPGLKDLCVSRSTFTWGVPIDFDPGNVVYVWIDALSNYITGAGYDVDQQSDTFKKYWPCDLQLVGKDIVRFHSIYWPIMLMALGLEPPRKVFGHPWLLVGDSKMSKSKGNVIYADDLVDLFGTDAVRYIMVHEMPYAQDGHITYDLMIDRINGDLANNLGNCVNRSISMVNKYFNGELKNGHVDDETLDAPFKEKIMGYVKTVNDTMEDLHVADALTAVISLFDTCNKYIDATAPWSLAKDPEQSGRLATVLYNLLDAVRIGAVLVQPFMPDTSEKILNQINTAKRDYDSIQSFGQLEETRVTDKPEILFRRLDPEEVMAKVEVQQEAIRAAAKKAQEQQHKAEITTDDFDRLDLRVGKVVGCEKHPDADDLLVLKVDLGEGQPRTIVSGLAGSYTPGQMIGKSIIVVANLKPAVIRGVESQGMLIAGKNGDLLAVAEVNGLDPGTKIY